MSFEVNVKMNCERCQELLSDFLDGVLIDEEHKLLNTHLEECLSCYNVSRELDSIVTFCRDHRGEYDAPPNERALWLRIRNTIESKQSGRMLAGSSSGKGRALNWVSGLLARQWELSLPQMAASVAAIVIAVAFATAFGMRTWQSNGTDNVAGARDSNRKGATALASGYNTSIDERLKSQQQVIDYWNERIDQRRAMWSAHTREAFERNLQVIDQAVYVYREQLQRNPHDEVSAEMLDSAMSDKMDLLREFSDL